MYIYTHTHTHTHTHICVCVYISTTHPQKTFPIAEKLLIFYAVWNQLQHPWIRIAAGVC